MFGYKMTLLLVTDTFISLYFKRSQYIEVGREKSDLLISSPLLLWQSCNLQSGKGQRRMHPIVRYLNQPCLRWKSRSSIESVLSMGEGLPSSCWISFCPTMALAFSIAVSKAVESLAPPPHPSQWHC